MLFEERQEKYDFSTEDIEKIASLFDVLIQIDQRIKKRKLQNQSYGNIRNTNNTD